MVRKSSDGKSGQPGKGSADDTGTNDVAASWAVACSPAGIIREYRLKALDLNRAFSLNSPLDAATLLQSLDPDFAVRGYDPAKPYIILPPLLRNDDAHGYEGQDPDAVTRFLLLGDNILGDGPLPGSYFVISGPKANGPK